MDNLTIYNSLREVPKEAQKSFSNGRFSGTDINPMWRIKRMTEIFGAAGFGWYYEVVNRHQETSTDEKTVCVFVAINLYVKDPNTQKWSKPIYGEGGNTFVTLTSKGYISTTDEAYKMALTDAFSNATKQLGLGADIWFEKDKQHSTKYDLQAEVAKDTRTPVIQITDTPEQQREKVTSFLATNPKAVEYYKKKFNFPTDNPELLHELEISSIYSELKRMNRI